MRLLLTIPRMLVSRLVTAARRGTFFIALTTASRCLTSVFVTSPYSLVPFLISFAFQFAAMLGTLMVSFVARFGSFAFHLAMVLAFFIHLMNFVGSVSSPDRAAPVAVGRKRTNLPHRQQLPMHLAFVMLVMRTLVRPMPVLKAIMVMPNPNDVYVSVDVMGVPSGPIGPRR